ncbi:outer membrane protein [Helicobacter pylori]|nr:outer membrane protein [Helicobacter pylori]
MGLGVKIPTINTDYSFMGTELKYRRLYSVYLNHVFAYWVCATNPLLRGLRNAALMSFD